MDNKSIVVVIIMGNNISLCFNPVHVALGAKEAIWGQEKKDG
ncbi:MAG: hypothetical protein WCS52_15965 [bacterium]